MEIHVCGHDRDGDLRSVALGPPFRSSLIESYVQALSHTLAPDRKDKLGEFTHEFLMLQCSGTKMNEDEFVDVVIYIYKDGKVSISVKSEFEDDAEQW